MTVGFSDGPIRPIDSLFDPQVIPGSRRPDNGITLANLLSMQAGFRANIRTAIMAAGVQSDNWVGSCAFPPLCWTCRDGGMLYIDTGNSHLAHRRS